MDSLKDIHDLLVAMKPEGASHDEDTCTICAAGSDQSGDDMADKTFTEAELHAATAAAVAEAVKPLEEKIKDLSASQESAEVESKIAEATAELTAKVEAVEAERDTAVIEAETAKTAAAELTAFLESVAAEEAATAETARLRDERIAKVAEVASFPAEYVEKNADRWASMEEAAFDGLLADYTAAGAKPAPKSEGGDTVPTGTAFTASRETSGLNDAVKEVIRLRDLRVDPRRI